MAFMKIVCIMVFHMNCYYVMVFFMQIVAFFNIRKGYVYVSDKCDFNMIINVIIF